MNNTTENNTIQYQNYIIEELLTEVEDILYQFVVKRLKQRMKEK